MKKIATIITKTRKIEILSRKLNIQGQIIDGHIVREIDITEGNKETIIRDSRIESERDDAILRAIGWMEKSLEEEENNHD